MMSYTLLLHLNVVQIFFFLIANHKDIYIINEAEDKKKKKIVSFPPY